MEPIQKPEEDELDQLLAELPKDIRGLRNPAADFPFVFHTKEDIGECWNVQHIGPLKNNGQFWGPILTRLRDEHPPERCTWHISCLENVYGDIERQQARQGQRPLMHLFQSMLNLHKAMMAWSFGVKDVRRAFEDFAGILAPQLRDAIRGRGYILEEGEDGRCQVNESIYVEIFLHTIIALNLLDARDFVLLDFKTCQENIHFINPTPLYNNINYGDGSVQVDPHKDIVPPKRTTKPYTKSEMPPRFDPLANQWLRV